MTTKKTTKKTKAEEAEPQVMSLEDEEVQETEAPEEEVKEPETPETPEQEPQPEPEPEPEPEQPQPEPEKPDNVVEVIVKEEPPVINTYVYIGPNLRAGLLRKNQIFKGGIPNIPGITDMYPVVNELFVLVSDRLEAMRQVNKKGTLLNLAYENMKGV